MISSPAQPEVIEGAYWKDLLAQPDVLRDLLEKLPSFSLPSVIADGLQSGHFKRVVLTGMGSSFHALYPLHRKLSRAGIISHWVETAELLLGFEPLYGPETLLVAVSQSGESAEVVKLLDRREGFGHVIGITNNPVSRLGRVADTPLFLLAGVESTVSCKTYLNTLATLHWLGAQLLREGTADFGEVEWAVRSYLADWRAHLDELFPLIEGIRDIFVTGRADSLATAGTGGLILKESTRLHAEGMSAAAFRHGPLEMINPSVLVLIFAGNETVAPLHRRLAQDINSGGGKAFLIGPEAEEYNVFRLASAEEALQPILEILPIQMLSLALAARDGFEAGHFQRASKITNTA